MHIKTFAVHKCDVENPLSTPLSVRRRDDTHLNQLINTKLTQGVGYARSGTIVPFVNRRLFNMHVESSLWLSQG